MAAFLNLVLEETNRLAGDIALLWDTVTGATSYDVYQFIESVTFDSTLITWDNDSLTFDLLGGASLVQATATSPFIIQGLFPDESYRYWVVANLSGGNAITSNEIAFQYGSTEILTVTPMARPGPYPFFPSVVVQ
jgi:hypothetical protein